MPFADYKDFQDCVNQNQDKEDPKAYCGFIQKQVKGESFKEKLSKLEKSSKIDYKTVKEVQDVDLVFDNINENTIVEFSNLLRRYMDKYDIGKRISKRFWGIQGYRDIQQTLYQNIKQQFTQGRRPTRLGLFDQLKDDVKGKKTKDYTNYHYSRVARTEGKAMSVLYQLERWRDARVEEVVYTIRDQKARDSHKRLNGKVYRIDYLLSNAGANERIPMDPNCRCRYKPKL